MDQETGVTRARVNASARNEGGGSIEEIRQNIEHTRNEITETVDQISEKFKQTFDWKAYVTNIHYSLLGAQAFSASFWRASPGQKDVGHRRALKNLIRTATNSLRPPKKSIFATVAAFGAKYAFDKYRNIREEETRQLELQQQLEQLQALQMLQHQMGSQTSGYPVSHHGDS